MFSEKVDLTLMIDKDYFKDTTSINNRKSVHKKPEFAAEPKLEISFEIGTIKLIIFAGADFDFKLGVPADNTTSRKVLD